MLQDMQQNMMDMMHIIVFKEEKNFEMIKEMTEESISLFC